MSIISECFGENKKSFCDTTQIDDKNHPLILHTILRTSLITDKVLVSVYSCIVVSSRPHKVNLKNPCCRVHTNQRFS